MKYYLRTCVISKHPDMPAACMLFKPPFLAVFENKAAEVKIARGRQWVFLRVHSGASAPFDVGALRQVPNAAWRPKGHVRALPGGEDAGWRGLGKGMASLAGVCVCVVPCRFAQKGRPGGPGPSRIREGRAALASAAAAGGIPARRNAAPCGSGSLLDLLLASPFFRRARLLPRAAIPASGLLGSFRGSLAVARDGWLAAP